MLTLHIVLEFEAYQNFAGLTGRLLDPSCRSAAHFYEDCVKLIRILRMGVFISLVNNTEPISVVVGLL